MKKLSATLLLGGFARGSNTVLIEQATVRVFDDDFSCHNTWTPEPDRYGGTSEPNMVEDLACSMNAMSTVLELAS